MALLPRGEGAAERRMRGSLAQLKLSPHPALSLRSGSTFSQREKGPTANFITEKPRTRFILNRTAVVSVPARVRITKDLSNVCTM